MLSAFYPDQKQITLLNARVNLIQLDLGKMDKDTQSTKSKSEVLAAVFALLSLLGIGTISFRLFENWSWIDSFYFSVVTLATVGYGDLTPKSEGARLFTAFYILFGATAALAALGIIGTRYLEKRGIKIQSKIDKK